MDDYKDYLVSWVFNSTGLSVDEITRALVQRVKNKIRIYERQLDAGTLESEKELLRLRQSLEEIERYYVPNKRRECGD